MKKNNSNKVKLGASDKIVRGFGYVVITIYALACIFPFLLILGSSFTAEEVIRTEGVQLIPKQFTLAAYEMVCKGGGIWKSYLLTIILTVVGTAVGLTIIAMTGYAEKKEIKRSSKKKCNIGISIHTAFHYWISGIYGEAAFSITLYELLQCGNRCRKL